MSDIFREVDEEVRRSQAELLWKRYGTLIIALCVLIVGSVAGYRYFEWRKTQAAEEAGSRFQAAMKLFEENKTSEGEAAMTKIAGEGDGIYRTLARFRAAGELGKRDAAAAITAFDQIAADAGVDQTIREAARLRAGTLAVDVQSLTDVEARLKPMTSPTAGWRHQAAELLAMAALKAGDTAKARQYLDQIIIDRETPEGIRTRAQLLIGLARDSK
ncbi:MAG: tetratricopeptide repeat protein [Beijerinckiaceae bacterium]